MNKRQKKKAWKKDNLFELWSVTKYKQMKDIIRSYHEYEVCVEHYKKSHHEWGTEFPW